MTDKWEVAVPISWCVLQLPLSSNTDIFKSEIVEWCIKTGIAGEKLAEKTVEHLRPAQYMNILFPKVDAFDSSLSKLYKLNAAIIVGGYIMDDVLECYTLDAIIELDTFFRSTEAWLSEISPSDYPDLDAISTTLSKITVPFSKAVICMFTDYFNQSCCAIYKIDKVSLVKVRQFRQRLSASVTAYLEMAMRKRRGVVVVDEKEFLWQRSGDNLGFPVLMFSEVFSNLLQPECTNIPTTIFHYFHMYSNLFAHVLNDLNSYHRDLNTDHNNLIKLWIKDGIASDFQDAARKIVQFLNSVIIRMHKAFAECSKQFPECAPLQRFLESTGYTFNGWILVHTTAVERYKLSPYQTTLAIVEEDKEEDWLKSESAFGKRCVQMFEELMQKRDEEMVALYGLSG